MKLVKTLRVNNQPFTLVDDEVRLDLTGPGRANLSVISDQSLGGLVQLDIGYTGHQSQRYFTGYIEQCTQLDNKSYRLFCRELAAVLNQDLPLALRNVNLDEVLKQIGDQTGIQFVTPKKAYAVERVPFFHHLGGGYMALDACGPVFNIPDFIWQQMGDGSVFVGSWQDSRWATRAIEIPNKWLTEQGQANQATIPLMPPLRPGILFNKQFRIESLRLSKERMEITWSKHSSA